jgi:hypothetical protein
MTDHASSPSSRSSQFAYVPSPAGTPCTTTSKTPPTVSPVRETACSTSSFMRCFRRRVHATQQDFFPRGDRSNLVPARRPLQLNSAHTNHMACNLNAQFAQQELGKGARRHTGGRLPRRSPLQHIARIGKVVLESPRQIGVTPAAATSPAGAFPDRRPQPAASLPSSSSRGSRSRSQPASQWFCRGVRHSEICALCRSRSSCGRRAHTPADAATSSRFTKSRSTGRPAGSPETRAIKASPCDSPAVEKRIISS